MSVRRSVLSLDPAVRPGGADRTRVEFLEFVIDGVRLGDEIRRRDGGATVMSDLVSVLVTDRPAGEVEQLLGRAPAVLEDGRLALYICPECGDLGCGAVTVTVDRRGPDTIVWRDPGWQTDYEPDVDFEPFQGLGPYQFDKSQYEEVLAPLLHHGKPAPLPVARPLDRLSRRWFPRRGRRDKRA